jgi:hypothetical protein
MSETPNSPNDSLQEPSLSDNDISILLGRAMQEDQLLTEPDLKNCSDADLYHIGYMSDQEIELRLPQIESEEPPSSLLFRYKKSEQLTGQLDLKNDELTLRQIQTLMKIKAQLENERNRRIHKEVEASLLAFEKTLSERSKKKEAVYEAIKKEFGENGLHLATLVGFGDSNIAPTTEDWGHITASLANGHEAAMDFIRKNAELVLKIDDELEKKLLEALHDPEARRSHFGIFFMNYQPLAVTTPEKIFARANEIKLALIGQGGCGREK